MLRHTLLALAIAATLAACNKGPQGPAGAGDKPSAGSAVAANTPADRPVLLTPEDLLTVQSNALASGPVVTGSIQPERRADLRAEVSAVVLQVLKENGEAVKKGDLLVRLDDTSIRDAMTSAQEAARASEQAFDQAQRTLERLKTLRASGMASAQQLDDAEVRRNNAQSDTAAAKARVVQARQQLQRTEVRAPFDGIVSDRKVSAGDTAAIGKELVKVIDPASMRFEGFVSADKISSVKTGQPVVFFVNGYGYQSFAGVVKRVDPSANPTTRQVEVLVAFNGGEQPKVAGLYAEGRVETGASQAVTVPESALVRNGDKSYAWRVQGNTLKKVDITVGERDPRRGDFPVKSGLASGDKIVRNPGSSLKDGQKIELAKSAQPAAAVATANGKAAAGSEK
jgi:membrane fusion protein, multidrug efflux system